MPRGFTLLETLLFIGASSIIVLIIAGLLHLILVAQTKQTIISEINETGIRALAVISSVVQDSSTITALSIGQNGSSLTLDRRNLADTPTVLDIASSTLRLTEGGQTPSALHSSRINASGLEVTNLSPTTSTRVSSISVFTSLRSIPHRGPSMNTLKHSVGVFAAIIAVSSR